MLDYDALYREYAPRVRALADRRLRGHHHGEDVVQEVFLRAYRAADTLDPSRPVWPWLRRIALNVCTDVLRAPRTWAEHPVEAVEEAARVVDADPTASLVAAEHRRLISDALDTLNPRHREVLLARARGVSSQDMAEDEGTSVEAVKAAVKRSRRGFRQAYFDLGKERGLLGPPAAPPITLRGLGGRLRLWASDSVRWLTESPAMQSLPAALSAAALLFGFGAGVAGPTVAGADEVARPSAVFAAAHGVLAGVAPTVPSSTARPGGGGLPPPPPPGHSGDGGRGGGEQHLVGANVDRGYDPNSGDAYTYNVLDSGEILGVPYNGHLSSDMRCADGPVSRAKCDAVIAVGGPTHVGYWS